MNRKINKLIPLNDTFNNPTFEIFIILSVFILTHIYIGYELCMFIIGKLKF